MGYEHLELEITDRVATIWLNRPEKMNAFSADLWDDLPRAVEDLNRDESVRAIIVAGRGSAFTVGMDLGFLAELGISPTGSPAVRSRRTYDLVTRLQATNNAFADSPKPTIAAIHGHCLGEGMNLMTACDVRLATADSVMSVRETRLGLVADVGVLQRLPGIVGFGHATELALTGRDISGTRAAEIGLVSHIYADQTALMAGANEIAAEIAANSPFAMAGVKKVLAANRGRTLEQALDYVASWSAAYLFSDDLEEAMIAYFERREPKFTGT